MLENQYVEISLQQISAIEQGSFCQICILRMLFKELIQPTVSEKMLGIEIVFPSRDAYVAT
jgi:hypothetical protein